MSRARIVELWQDGWPSLQWPGFPSSGRGKPLKPLDFALRAKGALQTVGKRIQRQGLFLGKIVQTTEQCTDAPAPLSFLAQVGLHWLCSHVDPKLLILLGL